MDRAATGAQPPLEPQPPEVHEPATVAGGVGAVYQTTRQVKHHLGVVRGARTLLLTNQIEGFDCPGCAWPEPQDHRSSFEFCENGAKAVASEATTRRVTPAFFAERGVEELARQSDFWLNEQGRLTHPMVLRPGAARYEPIAWDDAFALIAGELRALGSADEAAFYTSGRTSNEAAFLYQLFVRRFGTNNLPDCSNMCHESSGSGMDASLGVGKGTVTLEDFELADAIFIVGQNPGTNHPRMLSTLRDARRRGCAIVVVNPLAEAGSTRFAHPQDPVDVLGGSTEIGSLLLQVRINGDAAVFKGIMKAMLAREAAAPGTVLDRAFIEEHTDGFEAFARSLDDVSWEEIVRESGVPREAIERAARVAWEAERTIVCWAMGITQHKNGVANVQEIVNFLLLRGNVGKPGAGACPVRGHSNVQGDRTMGVWEKVPDAFLDRLGAEFGFEPPRAHGRDTVDTIRGMLSGEVKVFFGLGGNFLSATPDTERTADALRRCRLTVNVSTKLNRGHLVTGRTSLILPCLARSEVDVQPGGEQFVTVENSMSVVSMSRGRLPPASDELRSEVAIVAGVARATLGDASGIDWTGLASSYDAIRDAVARVVPGFTDYNARVREPGGFYLGNPVRQRVFRTATGKARFAVHPLPKHDLAPGRLLLMTMRSHDQYNTTVYGLDDRYRGIKNGRRVVFMNADDLAARGLAKGDLVDITSHAPDGERVAPRFMVVPYAIPRGCAGAYFPEANVLVPLDSVADVSNTPTSKSIVVSVARSTS
ncbi:MAG: FdhF/YdeP family oxidoreductase [Labilithrix sp.]|nr:FdhF/YdeP family oxidoreductase [Labilithrix sp.]MCW5832188.1 FdhF/YdeP family oxidoreductase [Labilithrix sp.]